MCPCSINLIRLSSGIRKYFIADERRLTSVHGGAEGACHMQFKRGPSPGPASFSEHFLPFIFFQVLLKMTDALCGPSNPLQNIQKHAGVDRTLQQDRLAFHRPTSEVNTLDAVQKLLHLADVYYYSLFDPRLHQVEGNSMQNSRPFKIVTL